MGQNILLDNLAKIHTTEMGLQRISKNLQIGIDDAVKFCIDLTLKAKTITRVGKNYYVYFQDIVITINAHNYCIITAHKSRK